jgi:hypothetical protein
VPNCGENTKTDKVCVLFSAGLVLGLQPRRFSVGVAETESWVRMTEPIMWASYAFLGCPIYV